MMNIQDTYTLRGICMLMIIFHHVFKFIPDCPLIIHILGDLGTSVFFFISGWGLYCSMEKRESIDWGYLWQNINKLLVPFFIVWAVTEATYQIIHPEIGWSGYGRIWFMQVITGAYVLSILTFILVKQRWLRVSIVTLLCGIYIIIAWRVFHLPGYRWCSSLCFPIGMWLSAYKSELKQLLDYKVTIVVLSTVVYAITRNYSFLVPHGLIYEPAFCLMTVSYISLFNIQSKSLYFIGKNSLLFYLIHISLLLLLSEAIGGINQYFMLIFLGVLAATLGLCYAYIKVENLIKNKAWVKK